MASYYPRPMPLRNETSFAIRDHEHMITELGYGRLYTTDSEIAQAQQPMPLPTVQEGHMDCSPKDQSVAEQHVEIRSYYRMTPQAVIPPPAVSAPVFPPSFFNATMTTPNAVRTEAFPIPVYNSNLPSVSHPLNPTTSPVDLLKWYYATQPMTIITAPVISPNVSTPPVNNEDALDLAATIFQPGIFTPTPSFSRAVSPAASVGSSASSSHSSASMSSHASRRAAAKVAKLPDALRGSNAATKGLLSAHIFLCQWAECHDQIEREGNTAAHEQAFQASVNRHIAEHAQAAPDREDGRGRKCLWRVCTDATSKLSNQRAIQRHIHTHIDHWFVFCHVCGKGLRRESSLRGHLLRCKVKNGKKGTVG
ncbi:hypothetical protein D9615_007503 [Tricholomella constricta]|uniref:C2H2-type domain-containing protein n=1 Tax=Tricholomella constricta TaxID=117010 RepID=A0A8H5H6W8_9AGAR|nr:hypothetical protein D9615_007503 [Tricholomella constricta]